MGVAYSYGGYIAQSDEVATQPKADLDRTS
jgi:hypothetical protein